MKNLFENLFDCNELKTINDLLVEAYANKSSAEMGKKVYWQCN